MHILRDREDVHVMPRDAASEAGLLVHGVLGPEGEMDAAHPN